MGAIDAIFAFVIAVIFYGAGPLYLASERKKPIQKIHYWLFCIIYDVVVITVFVMLTADTGSSYKGIVFVALALGTIFYFIGLSVLYKHGMVAGTPTQATTHRPPAEPEVSVPMSEPAPVAQAALAQPSHLPITETWYTCPSCGCLSRTGEICTCGYHPPKAEPPKVSVKKSKWLIVAVAALIVALACSVFYNVEQYNDLTLVQTQVDLKQITIENYSRMISSLREYKLDVESYINAVSFYASRACVVSSGSDWYHRDPTCIYCDLSYFWIYNVEQAVSRGYYQCPYCSALSLGGGSSSYLQYLMDKNK